MNDYQMRQKITIEAIIQETISRQNSTSNRYVIEDSVRAKPYIVFRHSVGALN